MPISLLFTGHMIDMPDRHEPRFPASLEPAAGARIARAVTPYADKSAFGEPALGFASGTRAEISFSANSAELVVSTP